MSATSLAEFILARVAEDEGGEVIHRKVGAGRVRAERDEPSERWLRQCQAVRRIVEQATDRCPHPPRIGGWCLNQCDVMLRHLASIWSDHPDYRQEWAA